MANCKICGKPAVTAVVHHASCWELAAAEAAGKFCDHYCRFPLECADEDELHDKHCDSCELIRLLNLGV